MADNWVPLIIDSGSYGLTVDQPTYSGMKTSLTAVAKACCCDNVVEVQGKDLGRVSQLTIDGKKVPVIICKCDSGNIKLPVVTIDPVVIRDRFMKAVAS